MIDEKTIEKFKKKVETINKEIIDLSNEAIDLGKEALDKFTLEKKIDPNTLRKAKQRVNSINL